MARLALDLLLLTGQRRGDIVNLGRKNLITMAGKTKVCLEQEKTGAKVSIPLLPELAESIRAATATAEGLTTFLISKSGQAFNSNYFGTCFNAWAVEAGLPERCTPHGLRKAFCRRLANQGKTPHEIAACTGHKTLAEVERYCREFDRERAAERAMAA
jgi:integrase